jgi:hypothetical protein
MKSSCRRPDTAPANHYSQSGAPERSLPGKVASNDQNLRRISLGGDKERTSRSTRAVPIKRGGSSLRRLGAGIPGAGVGTLDARGAYPSVRPGRSGGVMELRWCACSDRFVPADEPCPLCGKEDI